MNNEQTNNEQQRTNNKHQTTISIRVGLVAPTYHETHQQRVSGCSHTHTEILKLIRPTIQYFQYHTFEVVLGTVHSTWVP